MNYLLLLYYSFAALCCCCALDMCFDFWRIVIFLLTWFLSKYQLFLFSWVIFLLFSLRITLQWYKFIMLSRPFLGDHQVYENGLDNVHCTLTMWSVKLIVHWK